MAEQEGDPKEETPSGDETQKLVEDANERMGRMEQMLIDAQERNTRLENEVLAARNEVATPPPKVFSEAELDQLIQDGKIDEGQKAQVLREQMKRELKTELTGELAQQNQATSQQDKVAAVIQKYRDVMPDLATKGSENRQKAEEEYKALAEIEGQPADAFAALQMEARALRAAFGPPTKVVERTAAHAAADEQGSSGGGGSAAPSTKELGGLSLSDSQKAHYTRMIDQGLYKDWDAVKAEVNYKPKAVNQGRR